MRNNQLLSSSHLFVLPRNRLKANSYKSGVFWLTGFWKNVSRIWPIQSISSFVSITLVTLLFCITFNVEAQEVSTKTNDTLMLGTNNMTANQIAQKLANPNNALANLTLRNQLINWSGYLPGADGHNSGKFSFQPVFPFPLSKTSTIGFRPAISYQVNHPVFDEELGSIRHKSGFADMGYDLTYGNTFKSGLILRGGLTGGIPIGTEELSNDTWTLGPEIIVGLKKKYGIFLMFVSQQWNLGGPIDISQATIQPIIVFLPGKAWSVGSAPIMNYNWESNQWTVPLQVVTSKTVKLGKTPLKLAFEINYFVKSNDYLGQKWMFALNITPVVKNVLAQMVGL